MARKFTREELEQQRLAVTERITDRLRRYVKTMTNHSHELYALNRRLLKINKEIAEFVAEQDNQIDVSVFKQEDEWGDL